MEKVEKVEENLLDKDRIIEIIIDLMKGIECTTKSGKDKKIFVIESFTEIIKTQLISAEDEKFVDALLVVLPVMIDTFKKLDVNNIISQVTKNISSSCCAIF